MKNVLMTMVVAALGLAGCAGGGEGSEAKAKTVPDVVGERLDLAQALMDDEGIDYQEVGGGTFGIVEPDNWTVCETRPASGDPIEKNRSVKLIVERACASGTPSGATETQAGTVDETETETPATAPAPAPEPETITVPNVVGKDLQTAQDTMQAAGLYGLTSHDSTGLERTQLVDSNWVVTDQSPKGGTKVSPDQTIDLGAKKYSD